MAQLNNFDALQEAYQAANPTDAQIKNALREIYEALTIGGRVTPVLILDTATAPTDAVVQSAGVGGISSREIYDGMIVAIRSTTKLILYIRVAGTWVEVKNA